MALKGKIALAFRQQAASCQRLGSPFTAHLCRRLVVILDDHTVLGDAVTRWPLDPEESALVLRLCGAFHMAVRAGRAPLLAPLYPPAADTGRALDTALLATIAERGGDLVADLESAPQTNEVARSAILLGGLLTIARKTGLALALNEIGASAGLNLHPDCYGYDLGQGRRWGPGDAPLTIPCDWRGAAPALDAPLTIAARAGSDLAPIDPADAQARERVLGYIWPDQGARLERTDHQCECVDVSDVLQRGGVDSLAGCSDTSGHIDAGDLCEGQLSGLVDLSQGVHSWVRHADTPQMDLLAAVVSSRRR